MLKKDAPQDGIDLINKLLIFNPEKRLTANEALEHDYVIKFHEHDHDLVMTTQVTIPLNDDVRLSVDEYRNKLYEIMSRTSKTNTKSVNKHQSTIKLQMTEKYVKSTMKKYLSASEPKINAGKSNNSNATANFKHEPKLTKQNIEFNCGDRFRGNNCDCKIHMKSSSDLTTKKRYPTTKNNLYTAFNSYNRTHGIITESALMELKAAGLR